MIILVVHWSVYKYDDEIKKIIRTEKHHRIFRFEKNKYRGIMDDEECANQVLDNEGLRFSKLYGLSVGGPYTVDQYEKIWG